MELFPFDINACYNIATNTVIGNTNAVEEGRKGCEGKG